MWLVLLQQLRLLHEHLAKLPVVMAIWENI
jgi:hypothetical protein